MNNQFYRPSIVKVDLDAILHNYRLFSDMHKGKTTIAVIKANGYGLGAVPIAKHLSAHGAKFFAVATLDEAFELRQSGIEEKILVLGVVKPEYIQIASENNISLTVPSLDWLKEASALATGSTMNLHVKLDTGMNRIGIHDIHEYQEVVRMILANDTFHFEGVFTHFSVADAEDHHTDDAYLDFETKVNSSPKPEYIHCQNSAASIRFDKSFCNAIRLGISLYGYYPSPYVKTHYPIDLKPAMQLTSEVCHVKTIQNGDAVSYGRTYIANDTHYVSTVPLGYADGIPRKLQGFKVSVGNQTAEIIGRVCMDQLMLKTDAPVQVGERVIIIDNKDNDQSIDEVADHLETINYEVLTSLGRRLPREYHQNKHISLINDLLQ